MSAQQHDTLTTNEPQYFSGVEALRYPPSDMLAFRRDFVVKMGWFDESHLDDRDDYDNQNSTIHLVMRDRDAEVLSGMRLTKADTVAGMLSVDMLHSNDQMYQAALTASAALEALDTPTDVWDLTRLVHCMRGEDRFSESIESILAVFGAGLASTLPEEGRDLAWVFTTTEGMKQLLDASGIKSSVISRGKIASHDGQDSYFCLIHPLVAMQFLRDNQETYGSIYKTVDDGFKSAARVRGESHAI